LFTNTHNTGYRNTRKMETPQHWDPSWGPTCASFLRRRRSRHLKPTIVKPLPTTRPIRRKSARASHTGTPPISVSDAEHCRQRVARSEKATKEYCAGVKGLQKCRLLPVFLLVAMPWQDKPTVVILRGVNQENLSNSAAHMEVSKCWRC
jgi:hypothetical protein